ncbi:PTS sugar transporter subunit IIB [Niallia circulans]
MKTVMLVCAAGMSTSLLVTKMRRAALAKGLDINIFAVSATEIDDVLETRKVDCLLLGPQVKFRREEIAERLKGENILLDEIHIQHYGMMDGEKVLDQALSLVGS